MTNKVLLVKGENGTSFGATRNVATSGEDLNMGLSNASSTGLPYSRVSNLVLRFLKQNLGRVPQIYCD